jgi:putative endonuclease
MCYRHSELDSESLKYKIPFMKHSYVYIMASESKTIYIWITSNLEKRTLEHKNKVFEKWFTSKYNCDKLVYFEVFNDINYAIDFEKKLKNRRRDWKVALIEKNNLFWKDLSKDFLTFNDSESILVSSTRTKGSPEWR